MGMKACCSSRDTIAGLTLEESSFPIPQSGATGYVQGNGVRRPRRPQGFHPGLRHGPRRQGARQPLLPNDANALALLVAFFGDQVRGAIEACTGSADLADELVERHGWDLDLAHPGYVARMKQSPDKSDYSDAKMLADLVRVGYLPRVWLAPQDVRQLRTTVRYRQQLVDQRRATKLRVTALLREARLVEPKGRDQHVFNLAYRRIHPSRPKDGDRIPAQVRGMLPNPRGLQPAGVGFGDAWIVARPFDAIATKPALSQRPTCDNVAVKRRNRAGGP